MKKLMKRALALILVLVLMVPANVWADGEDNTETVASVTVNWSLPEMCTNAYMMPDNADSAEFTCQFDSNGDREIDAANTTTVDMPYIGSIWFTEFAKAQGAGAYRLEVRAYEGTTEVAHGVSAWQDFYKVRTELVLNDESGNSMAVPAGAYFTTTMEIDESYSYGSPGKESYLAGAAGVTVYASGSPGYECKGISVTPYAGGTALLTTSAAEGVFDFNQDVLVTISFQRNTTTVPVYLELGAGQETLAAAVAEELNDNSENSLSATADGTTVEFYVMKAQEKYMVPQIISSYSPTLADYESTNKILFCLNPLTSYTTMDSWSELDNETGGELVEENMVVYIARMQSIHALDVTIAPLVCGTEVVPDDDESSYQQRTDPEPAVTIAQNDKVQVSSAAWMDEEMNSLSGTAQGGTDYIAEVSLTPRFGYTFDQDDFDASIIVTVNGEVLEYFWGFIEIPVTAVHKKGTDGKCIGCGEDLVTVTFDSSGGSAVASQDLLANDTAIEPEDPVRDGFDFVGWQLDGADFDFAAAVSEDITLTAVWETEKPKFSSCSMVLDDLFGLNFYMDLSMLTEDQVNASRVVFTLNGATQSVSADEYVSKTVDNFSYYVVTCHLTSIQLADTVNAKLYYKDDQNTEQTVELNYTAETYLDALLNSEDYWDYGTLKELVRSIADYGFYAQKYLSDNALTSWTYGVDHEVMTMGGLVDEDPFMTYPDDKIAAICNATSQYEFQAKLNSGTIARVTYSLSLDSGTAINLYVRPADDSVSITSAAVTDENGQSAASSCSLQSDGRYKITIPGIKAASLGDMFNVAITTGSDTDTVTVGAMSYVYAGLSDEDAGDDEKNLLASLYTYWQAATDYADEA